MKTLKTITSQTEKATIFSDNEGTFGYRLGGQYSNGAEWEGRNFTGFLTAEDAELAASAAIDRLQWNVDRYGVLDWGTKYLVKVGKPRLDVNDGAYRLHGWDPSTTYVYQVTWRPLVDGGYDWEAPHIEPLV